MFENNIKIRLIVKQNGNNFLISNSTRCLEVLFVFRKIAYKACARYYVHFQVLHGKAICKEREIFSHMIKKTRMALSKENITATFHCVYCRDSLWK